MKSHANMLATSAPADRRESSSVQVFLFIFFYLQIKLGGVSLSTQASGSNTSPGDIVQDVAVLGLQLVC